MAPTPSPPLRSKRRVVHSDRTRRNAIYSRRSRDAERAEVPQGAEADDHLNFSSQTQEACLKGVIRLNLNRCRFSHAKSFPSI